MRIFQEHLHVLVSKVDLKHIPKLLSAKKGDAAAMEELIGSHIMQNLNKFDKVLQGMMNYEQKIADIDNRLKTLDTQLKENQSRCTENFNTFQDEPVRNPGSRNNKYEHNDTELEEVSELYKDNDEKSSMSSALKHFKENRPQMQQNYGVSPDLVKFVSMSQKGRNTACQPTIRDSPHNLVVEEKAQNTTKRKSSVPNAPAYTKGSKPSKKTGSAFANRHFSTERGQKLQSRDASDRTQINTSCVISSTQKLGRFGDISNPNSRQSNPNNYSGYAAISSISEPHPHLIEQLKKRGLGNILK